MKPGLEHFVWARPVEGYVWEDAAVISPRGRDVTGATGNDTDETRFLLWRSAESLVYRSNPLVDHPTLFRTFADLEPTEEAFLGFANDFGWLGISTLLAVNPADGATDAPFDPRGQGEPLWRWRQEHHLMRGVAVILTAVQNADIAFLKRWFQIQEDGVRYECEDPSFGLGQEWVCSPMRQNRDWLWQWGLQAKSEEERVQRFASGWAQGRINEAMSGRGAERQLLTSLRILFSGERDGMSLHVVPDSLIGAMWLQCARVLTEKLVFKACEQCGKWFELSADARRKRAKYCSARCKVAAYRGRKEQERLLAPDNLPRT